MESLRNEPVYFGGVPGTGTPTIINTPGNYGGHYDGMNSWWPLLLLGNRGYGNWGNNCPTDGSAAMAYAERAADNSSQILTEICKTNGDVRESINNAVQHSQIQNTAQFAILSDKLCHAELEAVKAAHKAEIEAIKAKADIIESANRNTISIKDDIKDFRFDVATKFCSLDNMIDKRFNCIENFVDKKFDRLTEREYQNKIDFLKEKLDSHRNHDLFRDVHASKHDLDKILCALSKIPNPVSSVPSILDGCGC